MDSPYRFLTLGIPWTQCMPLRDVNAATRLAEASWMCDKRFYRTELQREGQMTYMLHIPVLSQRAWKLKRLILPLCTCFIESSIFALQLYSLKNNFFHKSC